MQLTTLLKNERADHDVSTATLLSGKKFALAGPVSKAGSSARGTISMAHTLERRCRDLVHPTNHVCRTG